MGHAETLRLLMREAARDRSNAESRRTPALYAPCALMLCDPCAPMLHAPCCVPAHPAQISLHTVRVHLCRAPCRAHRAVCPVLRAPCRVPRAARTVLRIRATVANGSRKSPS